jgi:hypothetical protein
MTSTYDTDAADIGFDLEITKVDRRTGVGGARVGGRLGGHRFEALVFPERAQREPRDGSITSDLPKKSRTCGQASGKLIDGFSWRVSTQSLEVLDTKQGDTSPESAQ